MSLLAETDHLISVNRDISLPLELRIELRQELTEASKLFKEYVSQVFEEHLEDERKLMVDGKENNYSEIVENYNQFKNNPPKRIYVSESKTTQKVNGVRKPVAWVSFIMLGSPLEDSPNSAVCSDVNMHSFYNLLYRILEKTYLKHLDATPKIDKKECDCDACLGLGTDKCVGFNPIDKKPWSYEPINELRLYPYMKLKNVRRVKSFVAMTLEIVSIYKTDRRLDFDLSNSQVETELNLIDLEMTDAASDFSYDCDNQNNNVTHIGRAFVTDYNKALQYCKLSDYSKTSYIRTFFENMIKTTQESDHEESKSEPESESESESESERESYSSSDDEVGVETAIGNISTKRKSVDDSNGEKDGLKKIKSDN